MDAKAELNRVLKDLQASAREFAAMGLAVGTKALQFTGAHLKTFEESLSKTAERLKKDAEPTDAAAPAEATKAVEAPKA